MGFRGDRFGLEPLEPRLLLSADPALALAADVAAAVPTAEVIVERSHSTELLSSGLDDSSDTFDLLDGLYSTTLTDDSAPESAAAITEIQLTADPLAVVNPFADPSPARSQEAARVSFLIDGANAGSTTNLTALNLPSTFTFVTPAGADNILIDSPAAGQTRISGTSGGIAFDDVIFTNVEEVIIDAGAHDTAGSRDDIVTISQSLAATGLKSLVIRTGDGDDALHIDSEELIPEGSAAAITFEGGIGNDTIRGPDAPASWAITGQNAGSFGSAVTFTGVEFLVGGSDRDEFTFSDGAAISGSISAGGTENLIDYEAYTTPIAVNLVTGAATGTAGTSGLSEVIGGSGVDTLVGPNVDALWLIGAENSGTISTTEFNSDEYAFDGIENLTGGTGRDTFAIGGEGSIAGTINGGAGTDSLLVQKGPDLDYAIVNVVNGNTGSVIKSGSPSKSLDGPDKTRNLPEFRGDAIPLGLEGMAVRTATILFILVSIA